MTARQRWVRARAPLGTLAARYFVVIVSGRPRSTTAFVRSPARRIAGTSEPGPGTQWPVRVRRDPLAGGCRSAGCSCRRGPVRWRCAGVGVALGSDVAAFAVGGVESFALGVLSVLVEVVAAAETLVLPGRYSAVMAVWIRPGGRSGWSRSIQFACRRLVGSRSNGAIRQRGPSWRARSVMAGWAIVRNPQGLMEAALGLRHERGAFSKRFSPGATSLG